MAITDQSFTLGQGRNGVLLIHGLGGTPIELALLGFQALLDLGCATFASLCDLSDLGLDLLHFRVRFLEFFA